VLGADYFTCTEDRQIEILGNRLVDIGAGSATKVAQPTSDPDIADDMTVHGGQKREILGKVESHVLKTSDHKIDEKLVIKTPEAEFHCSKKFLAQVGKSLIEIKKGSILLQDGTGASITLSGGEIYLNAKGVNINAKKDVIITASKGVDVTGTATVKVTGALIELNE